MMLIIIWLRFLTCLVILSFIFMSDICRGGCHRPRHSWTEWSSDWLWLLQLVTVIVRIPATLTQGVYCSDRVELLLLVLGHRFIKWHILGPWLSCCCCCLASLIIQIQITWLLQLVQCKLVYLDANKFRTWSTDSFIECFLLCLVCIKVSNRLLCCDFAVID